MCQSLVALTSLGVPRGAHTSRSLSCDRPYIDGIYKLDLLSGSIFVRSSACLYLLAGKAMVNQNLIPHLLLNCTGIAQNVIMVVQTVIL